jgi:hypothetical protein
MQDINLIMLRTNYSFHLSPVILLQIVEIFVAIGLSYLLL